MRILFHLPILPPKEPKFEAYSQEIAALSEVYDCHTLYINPNQHIPPWMPMRIPRLAFGFQRLREIRRLEEEFDLHQIYNPDPYAYPALSYLKKPIVYVLSGSGVASAKTLDLTFFRRYAAVAVYDPRTIARITDAGIGNVRHIHSGVNTAQFTYAPRPLEGELHLLIGSAPWAPSHFASKGIDTLLEVAAQIPQLRLTFLWRGVLMAEMQRKISALDLGSRVVIVDKLVDVNDMLANVHGTILLANNGDVVKAYPHSLIDSLAAGKPIIVSRAIPMSDYVDEAGVGYVVENVTSESVRNAIEAFTAAYEEYSRQAEKRRAEDFSLSKMLNSYEALYSNLAI